MMKRKIISNIFMLCVVSYFIWLISRPEFYLSDISMHAKNPLSISWHYLTIDTGIIGENHSEDDYIISLYPFYFMLFIAFMIRFIPFKKKHKE
ncbi:hypothetical protein BFS35_004300 [Macrococcoides goetzii]|uniref:Uncharacterized protein n=1 Tax=Macrococcoides goetzii TaxID=1891097 RepID=A0A2G5NS43_9STAP|nr:hypothetical protein [Macrococcus goetzii]RAI82914.1 hypothetical protein BFS35_004300 [Macrococcus goetzii]